MNHKTRRLSPFHSTHPRMFTFKFLLTEQIIHKINRLPKKLKAKHFFLSKQQQKIKYSLGTNIYREEKNWYHLIYKELIQIQQEHFTIYREKWIKGMDRLEKTV